MPDFGDVNPDTGRGSARTEFEGTVDPYAPSVANGQISPEQWAEYQKKRKRDAIFGLLGTLGLTTGLGALGAGIRGAGAGAGALNSASGALPAIEGGAPWAVTPFATTATMSAPGVGAGIGAGVGAGAGAASSFMGLSPRDIAALAAAGIGTVGGALDRPENMQPNTQTTDPNLQKLMQTMQGRLDQSEPLYKSIMAMANGLLPMQYQNGGAGRG